MAEFKLVRRPRLTGPLQYKVVQSEVRKRLRSFLDSNIINIFKNYVNNWRNQPKFKAKVSATLRGISAEVFIDNPDKVIDGRYGWTIGRLWNWLNAGTEGHDIGPRPDNDLGLLFFTHGTYTAKTGAGVSPSFGGPGSRSGPTIPRTVTTHPGMAARDFTGFVFRSKAKQTDTVIDTAYRAGLKKAERLS